jgi:hypothetical protein
MANFDRERLSAILTSARIEASKKNIKELDFRLKLREMVYWAQKKTIVAGPSKELLDLHIALGKWLERCIVRSNENEPNPYVDELLLVIGKDDNDQPLSPLTVAKGSVEHKLAKAITMLARGQAAAMTALDELRKLGEAIYKPNDEIQCKNFETIIWLFKATKKAADLLEAYRPHTRRAGAETYLFRRLYDDYCGLSGRQKLSNTGPPIRFVKECAEIIVPGIVVPDGLRQRLERDIARNVQK